MAPTVLTLGVYYVLCFLLSTISCSNLACSSKDCRKNACPSSCSCLGYLVDCAKRNLDAIPKDLPAWVEMLDLQNNNINFIEDNSLEGLRNLRALDLSNNRLSFINSSTLQHLTSLQELVVHSNHLTEMPNLVDHPSLTMLSLQHNEIYNLNASILENFPNLRILDFSHNNLEELKADTFGYSSSLLQLSLSHNRIANIEKGTFDNLTVLEALKLNKNKLLTIPKELFRHLSNLRQLEINSNTLYQIEGLSFQGLVSLAVLKLRHSGISVLLDGAFYGLNSIKRLQLDFNNINKITKGWLYGLNSLQRLYLTHNNISMIEDDAWDSGGKRLLELDMAKNQLQYISSKTFDKLYSLKRLILSNNKITYIEEGSFRSLSALQYLELKNNEVSWTIEDASKVFLGLERLRFLGLSNNKIKSIVRRAFNGLSRLETLNLTQNPLTTIEQNAFDDLPELHELLINTSSLLCDCNLNWIANNFHYPITAKCAYPDRMKSLSVFHFSAEDFVCDGLPKPVIVKEPSTKLTLQRENVTLECQAKTSDASEIKFQWRKDGKLLPNMRLWSKNTSSKHANFVLHTSWLFIENIQNKDEGRYQCVISNHYGSAYSNKARITVHVFPVFTKTPVDVAIKSGSTARLECGASGSPQPDIAWKKDGGGEDFPAARERRMHVMPTDDIFFIVDVKASDTGLYQCTAQNVAGIITANATLTVLETPTFVKKMENKEVRIGDTAVLECRSSGNPKPKLTWTKDGIPLVITDRHFFTVDNQLLVIDLTKYSDSGAYTCEMSNTLGTERGTSHLKVLPANVGDENNMTGIVVIAVVVCIVGTSIIWVIVIHRTRKPREDFVSNARSGGTPSTDVTHFTPYRTICSKELKQSITNIFLDSHSGHSKDSGTGDSAQPSNDDLLIEEDDHGLLLNLCSSKRTVPQISSLMALQDSVKNSQTIGEAYASSNSSVSKEQVPLLQSFRTSRSPWKNQRKSIAEFREHPSAVDWYSISCGDTSWPCILVQRSMSADQVNTSESPLHHRGCSEPPQDIIIARLGSDNIERDSGFSTFPRSVTQASVSNWNSESPRLHRLPRDVPNDSGSFSIASEEVQILSNPAKCISNSVMQSADQAPRISKSCVGKLDQKAS